MTVRRRIDSWWHELRCHHCQAMRRQLLRMRLADLTGNRQHRQQGRR